MDGPDGVDGGIDKDIDGDIAKDIDDMDKRGGKGGFRDEAGDRNEKMIDGEGEGGDLGAFDAERVGDSVDNFIAWVEECC